MREPSLENERKKARELQPDLILMDIGLPKLNRIQAAKPVQFMGTRIRRMPGHKRSNPLVGDIDYTGVEVEQ